MSDVPKKSGKQWRFSFKPTAFQLQTKQSFLFSRYLFLLSEKREAPDICWLPWHSNYSVHYDQNQLKSSNHLNCVWKHTDNQSQSKRQPFNGFSKQPRWNVTEVLSLQLTVETKSSENVHLQHSEFIVSVWLDGCRTGSVQTTHTAKQAGARGSVAPRTPQQTRPSGEIHLLAFVDTMIYTFYSRALGIFLLFVT